MLCIEDESRVRSAQLRPETAAMKHNMPHTDVPMSGEAGGRQPDHRRREATDSAIALWACPEVVYFLPRR